MCVQVCGRKPTQAQGERATPANSVTQYRRGNLCQETWTVSLISQH